MNVLTIHVKPPVAGVTSDSSVVPGERLVTVTYAAVYIVLLLCCVGPGFGLTSFVFANSINIKYDDIKLHL